MTTISKFSIKNTHGGQAVVYHGEVNSGRIAYNLTTYRWEYNPYGQPVKAVGTYEDCLVAAKADHVSQFSDEPLVEVVAIHRGDLPTYIAQGWGTWKQHGPGNSTKVTVRDSGGEFDIWIPSSFARRVSPGSYCLHRHDRVTGSHFLAWPAAPVTRSSVAA